MIPQTIQMSQFALSAQYEDIPEGTADQLKRHLLDSIGSFIFAQDQMPIIKLRNAFVDLQGENKSLSIRDLSFDKLAQYFNVSST